MLINEIPYSKKVLFSTVLCVISLITSLVCLLISVLVRKVLFNQDAWILFSVISFGLSGIFLIPFMIKRFINNAMINSNVNSVICTAVLFFLITVGGIAKLFY